MDSFEVRTAGDRINFDIFLPGDAGLVTGIHFVASLGNSNTLALQTRTWSHSNAGLVSLRWADRGDIFHQAGVALPKSSHEENYSPLGLVSPGGSLGQTREFSANGRRVEALDLEVPGHLRQIKGFFKDTLLSLTGTGEVYTVDYFVHYNRNKL